MITFNKRIILSILVSLLFSISLIVGEAIGTLLSEIFFFIYRYVNYFNFISDWQAEIGRRLLQGMIAGYIAGYVNVLIYKDFDYKTTIIFPLILLSVAILSTIFVMVYKGEYFERLTHICSLVASGYFYITYLKDHRKVEPSSH